MLMMIKRSNRGKLSGSLGGRALLDMKKGTKRKRSLWSLVTVAVAIALVGLFTVGVGVSYADTPSTTDSAPEHHKTLKYNSDGTYDVTLTVQGKVESHTTTNEKPVDVIIVFDRSNSMQWTMSGEETHSDSNRRMTYAKNAANSLITSLFGSENIDARVSVVDFGTFARVHTATGGASTESKYAAWYSNEKDAKSAINNIKSPGTNDGLTNWQDAFRKANDIKGSTSSNGSSRNAARYIVFLSDGDPTCRDEYIGNDMGNIWTGTYAMAWYRDYWGVLTHTYINSEPDANEYLYFGTDGDGKGYSFDCGVKEANLRESSTTLYSIGLSADASKMNTFANRTKPNTYFSAINTTGLNEAFENIAKDITGSNKSYKGVIITDTLSQWAEFSDQNVTVTYQKTTDKGIETYTPNTPAQVDMTHKKVTWAVNDSDGDTTLDDGAIYSITFKVRPNQAAYDRALKIKNNTDEPDPGEYATGEANLDDPAIFSNVNDNASATGVSGTQKTTITNNESSSSTFATFSSAYVEKPVMHVPVSLVKVTKTWDKSVPTEKRGDVTVVLKKKSGDAWVDVDGGTLILNESNQWTATKYVVAGVDEQTYRVDETDIANQNTNAFNISCAYSKKDDKTNNLDSLTFEGRKHCEGTATITNSLKVYTLTITKKVTGNFGDTSKAFSFTLTDASDKAITNVKAVEGTSGDVRLENNGSFTLKNDQKLVVELPYGASYKVVENVPNDPKGAKDTVGYTTTIDAGDSGANIDNEKRTASSPEAGITKETTITYTNKREVSPDVGVDLGSGAPYAAVFGGVGIAGVIWMVLKRRNSLGI